MNGRRGIHFLHAPTSQTNPWKWEHKPELQDSSLHSPLQALNWPRNSYAKIPQWMLMLEWSLCFLNPFIFMVKKVRKIKSQTWSWTNSTRLLEFLCIKVNESASLPGGKSCGGWYCTFTKVVRLENISTCNKDRVQILHRSCSIVEGYPDAVVVADDSNDWSKLFACKDVIATGATGMVLAGTLIAHENPPTMKRFIAAGVSWAISVPAITIPVAPLASNLLQAKMLLQSLESSAAAFFASTLDESLHGGFLQRTMGSALSTFSAFSVLVLAFFAGASTSSASASTSTLGT